MLVARADAVVAAGKLSPVVGVDLFPVDPLPLPVALPRFAPIESGDNDDDDDDDDDSDGDLITEAPLIVGWSSSPVRMMVNDFCFSIL